MGIPVVIADNGIGVPINPVDENAPVMTVADNGLGVPIVISELGAPFIVEGIAPPIDWDWQAFSMSTGGDGFQWVGYSVGGVTLPNPAFGSISNEPTDKATLLAFYQDTASGVVLAVFSGEWETELAGLEVSLGGLVLEPFEIEIIGGNTWLRYDGMPGLWAEGAVYEVLFGWGLQPVFDPSAEALFARFTTEPTNFRKWLINNLIVSLKDDGIWEKLDAFWMMAAHDGQAAQRNWLADQYNLSPVSSPAFTADRGYQGDGALSYLRTGFNPAIAGAPKFTQNSASFGFWSLTELNGSGQDVGNSNSVILPRTNNQALYRVNNGGAASGTAVGGSTSSLGLFTALRSAANTERLRRNAASLSIDAGKASGPPADSEFILLARNSASVSISASGFSIRQSAMAFIGGGLTDGESDALFAATQTYLQAVGAV